MLFYAAFVTGMGGPVSVLARSAGLKIVKLLDGALLYEAEAALMLPCFNHQYEALHWKPAASTNEIKPLMKAAAAKPGAYGLKRSETAGTFRIVVSDENRLVAADANLKKRLEQVISEKTGLTPDRGGSKAGEEFWFLYRREGFVFFMRRLAMPEKMLNKGELRPDLAYLLNALSEPKDDDILLDPFCGYGAIPEARRSFPYRHIYAADSDKRMVNITRERLKDFPNSTVARADVNDESYFLSERSVNKIVTDPPWGLFDAGVDLELLYTNFLRLCLRVVKPGSIIVVLTSRVSPIRAFLACPEYEMLKTRAVYDILVSGKKACIWVISKGG